MSNALSFSQRINCLTHLETISFGMLILGVLLLLFAPATAVWANDPVNQPEDLSSGLVSFNAKEQNRDVLITWETSGELHRLRFEIQQRENANDKWHAIGQVESKGTNSSNSYEYVARNAGVGSLHYRLKQINQDGSFLYSPDLEIQIAPERTSSLGPDALTEFNPGTFIRYELSETSYVKLVIYNTNGEPVRTLVNDEKGPGNYAVRWDGKDAAGSELVAGSYFYTLKIYGDPIVSKQVLTIK